jgi:hypothetical protein
MTEEQKKRRKQFQQEREAWKKKYGEITLLDFPQFTRNTYPGVTKMDLSRATSGTSRTTRSS